MHQTTRTSRLRQSALVRTLLYAGVLPLLLALAALWRLDLSGHIDASTSEADRLCRRLASGRVH